MLQCHLVKESVFLIHKFFFPPEAKYSGIAVAELVTQW